MLKEVKDVTEAVDVLRENGWELVQRVKEIGIPKYGEAYTYLGTSVKPEGFQPLQIGVSVVYAVGYVFVRFGCGSLSVTESEPEGGVAWQSQFVELVDKAYERFYDELANFDYERNWKKDDSTPPAEPSPPAPDFDADADDLVIDVEGELLKVHGQHGLYAITGPDLIKRGERTYSYHVSDRNSLHTVRFELPDPDDDQAPVYVEEELSYGDSYHRRGPRRTTLSQAEFLSWRNAP